MTSKTFVLVALLFLSLAGNVFLFLKHKGASATGADVSLATPSEADNAFKDFETVAFAREFAERFASFESESFRSTQTALSFLLDEKERSQRLEEIDRLSEKLSKKSVVQRGRLMRLARRGEAEDAFQADLHVDLLEGAGVSPGKSPIKNQFRLKLSFEVKKVDRTAQNPWGYLIGNLQQEVSSVESTELKPQSILVRPQSPVLLRFPCVIENVELPMGTPIRVRLTTLDVSELQMRTVEPLIGEHKMRAVCRDRAYRVSLSSDLSTSQGDYPLTSIQSYTIAQSEAARPLKGSGARRAKSAVEKSIEEQLGFVIEAE